MRKLIRQGDILLVPVEATPPHDAKRTREVVLAEGELTGHSHRLAAPVVLDWGVAGQRFVRVQGDDIGTLTHEDHDPTPAPVVHPEQSYMVVRQREWSLDGEWKQVTD